MAVAIAPRTLPAEPARQAEVAAPAVRVLVFFAVAAAYALLGSRLVAGLDVVAPDGVDRLARAYLAWHGEPAKLATIGFGAPPLPALALLPFALVGPLATSLVALPLFGGVCGAVAVLSVDRALARCGLRAGRRTALVALFALNPIVAFQFTTGTPAALALALVALALRGLVGWAAGGDPRALLGAGVAFAGALLCRYELAAWTAVAGVLIALALAVRGADRAEAEGSATAFGAPAVAAVAVWTLVAAAIVSSPFGWIGDAWEAGSPAGVSAGDALGRTLELTGLAFPLAVLAVAALLVGSAATGDAIALGLAALLGAGAIIAGLHAYAADATGPLGLAAGALLLLAALAGVAWAYRGAGRRRAALWGAAVAVLIVGDMGAWRGLEHYAYGTATERAWARAVRTGDDQATTAGARAIGRAVRRARPAAGRVLADENAAAAAIVLSERPGAFLTRAGASDKRWRAAVAAPRGRVDYLLAVRGDAVDRARPGLVDGRDRGAVVVAAAGPYVLARVLH